MTGDWRLVCTNPAQVAALTLAAFGLMSIGIGNESLWLDEAESWVWSLVPLAELSAVTGYSNHAPTYYTTLHGWRLIGGESETWLRLLSALFMALTVPVVYLLARTVSKDHKTGMFSALVFASSPFAYAFGQEARPYAMLTFFGGVGILCIAAKIRECVTGEAPVAVGRGWSEGRIESDLLWLGFMAASLVVITTHHRSNVESTMWMIKSKFGAFVRTKSDVAQFNEVLGKVLCHNIVVLVGSAYELGIEPQFQSLLSGPKLLDEDEGLLLAA